jgi:hypothetical protein
VWHYLDGMSVIPDLAREAYEKLDALNWSRLKLIEKSPAHFKQGFGEDSDSFTLGTAAHMAVLEPEKFKEEYVIYPGRRQGKAWEEFESKAIRSGKTVLNATEYGKAVGIKNAVRANKRADELLSGGKAEVAMVWTLGGGTPYETKCKGRADYIGSVIADLKSTQNCSPREFARSCVKYGYLGQAAWYTDGYEALTGQRLPYYIVAVESNAPHLVTPYRVPEHLLAIGRDQYQTLLGKLDYCKRNNFWGGYTEADELNLELPSWHGED